MSTPPKKTCGFPASSAVRAIRYHDAQSSMDVVYASGNAYRYEGVPRPLFDAFCRTGSAGHFLHEYVLSRFHYERL